MWLSFARWGLYSRAGAVIRYLGAFAHDWLPAQHVRWRTASSESSEAGTQVALRPQPTAAPETRRLGFRERSRLRRRVRFLRKRRELELRDLGGLIFDMYRFGSKRQDLVRDKLQSMFAADRELREFEHLLAGRQRRVNLREAGVGGACPRCQQLYSTDAQFCSNCGETVTDATQPDLVVEPGTVYSPEPEPASVYSTGPEPSAEPQPEAGVGEPRTEAWQGAEPQPQAAEAKEAGPGRRLWRRRQKAPEPQTRPAWQAAEPRTAAPQPQAWRAAEPRTAAPQPQAWQGAEPPAPEPQAQAYAWEGAEPQAPKPEPQAQAYAWEGAEPQAPKPERQPRTYARQDAEPPAAPAHQPPGPQPPPRPQAQRYGWQRAQPQAQRVEPQDAGGWRRSLKRRRRKTPSAGAHAAEEAQRQNQAWEAQYQAAVEAQRRAWRAEQDQHAAADTDRAHDTDPAHDTPAWGAEASGAGDERPDPTAPTEGSPGGLEAGDPLASRSGDRRR
jgi:hypothetical protein